MSVSAKTVQDVKILCVNMIAACLQFLRAKFYYAELAYYYSSIEP